ncbi:MAG: alpha-L-fucosidase [Puniceicoccales bacterium]|jgi:alpha-L-fucosidase|nr:alpha-L-fucosidase [Puniceicoccales bacterium]
MKKPFHYFCASSLLAAGTLGFSANILAETPPPAPYGALPTPRQVKHAEREFYSFAHFTVDTFVDREWGLGTESEQLFNPTQFDADQIVGVLKEAGSAGLIITAKHHDGFCLWPTKTTEHSVAASPFRDGKGDVVREIADACKKAGIEFGVYLSPWDRNHPTYGTPEYVDVYRKQWEELLTNYGPVFSAWMDGANGGTGYYKGKVGPVSYQGELETRKINPSTYYDWPTTWAMIRKWQPDAIMFSDVGPDSRWIGNERGLAPDPCLPTITYTDKEQPGIIVESRKLGTGTRGGKLWVQAEADVSIRPGWFWHEKQNLQVRSPENLMNLYLNSVGRGATLNLNVPPDARGLLHENDVSSLKIFGDHLRKTFGKNLAKDAAVKASNIRGNDTALYGPQRLLDDDRWSAWVTDDTVTTPEVVFELPSPGTFNMVRLREDIRLGLRLEGVAVDAWLDGKWKEIAKAEAIGPNRLWRVNKVTTDKVRVRVTKSPVAPALSDFGLYLEPELQPWFPPVGGNPQVRQKFQWKVISTSYAAQGAAASRAIDGDPKTLWHTHDNSGERDVPQEIVVDMGAEKTLAGLTYLPRQDGTVHGMVDEFEFYLSNNGKAWTRVAKGEFGNLRANPIEQTVSFPETRARYFKFVATHVLEKNHIAIAEIGVVEK